jgi:hypothetical protein
MVHNQYHIIIGNIFESKFLINLFRDTNIVRIFYKSSQTRGMYAADDRHLGTEEVLYISTSRMPCGAEMLRPKFSNFGGSPFVLAELF